MSAATTIDPEEIERFSKIAAEWWDPTGKFKPLHKFNPVRLAFIRDAICARYDRDPSGERPLAGLRLVDIGCGGGLIAEPMRRLGAEVVGIDAAARNVKTAAAHAAQSELQIDYRATSAEALAAGDEPRFDVVLNLEVIEHVADRDLFLRSAAALLKPGGIMILATLNRTLKSLALAKIGAEYVVRWLPAGTHDWRKFVTPAELRAGLAGAGLTPQRAQGVVYHPLSDRWALSEDVSVNYMMIATKPSAA